MEISFVDRVERLGRLDVVVNNPGGAPPADTSSAPPRFTERFFASLLSAMSPAPTSCSMAAVTAPAFLEAR